MAQQANDELVAQLRAEVLALQDAATAASLAVADATAAAALAATTATAAAVQQATAAAVQQGAAAPPRRVFSLAPALANTNAFRDLTTANGMKHFKGAVEPLNSHPFDFVDGADLQVFLDLVLTKSQVWGWNTIFTIPVLDPLTAATTYHNLLSEYGRVPLESVRTQALTYYATETKRAQDSFMACQCLLSSLTLDFLKLITADSSNYHLPAIVVADGPVPSGPLLLKLIISQAHVDSRATVSFIRISLTHLDIKMVELESNIEAFNFYVKAQVKGLSARGEQTMDLLVNLFKGYKAANDNEFLDFIHRKENAYEEGEDINTNNLMEDSLAKYKP